MAPFMPFSRRGEFEAGAVREHQPAALDAHALGHDQHQSVALHGRHHREAHTGVARGGFDDGAAGLQASVLLGSLDHREGDAVLDGTPRVRPLALHVDVVAGPEKPVDADVRGVADGLQDVLGEHEGSSGRGGKLWVQR
jgi:hypothetical protein